MCSFLPACPSPSCLQYFLSKGEFEPQGISTLMYGCVLLDYSNGLLNRAAALAATDQLQRFGAQALANTLWALAHMAFYHKPLLEGALGVVAARPGDFKPQELANIIWAITRQRHHPGAAAGPLVRSLLERPTSLSGQDIATVLYMLATFSIAPGGPILRSLLSELLARLPNMAVQQQAAAYWSLGMLREVNMPVFAALEASIDGAHAASPLDESTLRMVFQGFACSKLAGSERLPGFSPLLLDAMKRAWVGSAAISNRDSAVLDALAEVLKQLKVRDLMHAKWHAVRS